MSSGLDHKRDWTRLAKSRPKTGQNCSREGNRGRLNSSFSAFIHFATDRTLTGWALLFAMGKVTSDDFLCDREHVRVWKCRKTGTKVRSQSGSKTRPGQHPPTQKTSIYRQIVSPAGPKKESKIESKNDPKMMGK
jgi:hypothetical protein